MSVGVVGVGFAVVGDFEVVDRPAKPTDTWTLLTVRSNLPEKISKASRKAIAGETYFFQGDVWAGKDSVGELLRFREGTEGCDDFEGTAVTPGDRARWTPAGVAADRKWDGGSDFCLLHESQALSADGDAMSEACGLCKREKG
jgi:hypothetical protein